MNNRRCAQSPSLVQVSSGMGRLTVMNGLCLAGAPETFQFMSSRLEKSSFPRPTILDATKSFIREKIEEAPLWAPRLARDRGLRTVDLNYIQRICLAAPACRCARARRDDQC